MSMTNEEKKLLVGKIFDKLTTIYKLDGREGLAKFLDVKYQTLKGWERRGNIADIKPFLFKCQNISPKFLETGEPPIYVGSEIEVRRIEEDDIDDKEITKVPVYRVEGSCGDGIINNDAQVDYWLSFTSEFARAMFGTVDHGLCCIKAAGESMTPTIHPGDTVVLNRNENTFTRDGAIYVMQRGETTLIKRLHQLRGKLRVASDNTEKGATEDMTFEELEADGYLIIGRVVYIGKLA